MWGHLVGPIWLGGYNIQFVQNKKLYVYGESTYRKQICVCVCVCVCVERESTDNDILTAPCQLTWSSPSNINAGFLINTAAQVQHPVCY